MSTSDKLAGDFLASQPGQAGKIFPGLVAAFRRALAQGEYQEVANAFRLVATPSLDYTQAQALLQIRKGLRDHMKPRQQVKVSILGSFTTKQLLGLIDLFLCEMGVEAQMYESDYGVFRQELIDPLSGLYKFAPQIVFLATSSRDLSGRPNPGQTTAEGAKLAETELEQWSGLWEIARQHLNCQIIQNNFVIPAWRSFANQEMRQPGSIGRFIGQVNQLFNDRVPPYVTLHDVDYLAAAWGRWRWDDPRFFHQAKLPCNPECLVDYAHSVASIIGAQLGLAKKCLVLDLDNTLWGGVIGDDGLGGIRLGQGNAEGEAFLEFQQYVRSLRRRGILLAVCSKNNHATAMEPFEKHPEMVLRKEDISCFVANWEDKAANLRSIARQLNIGLDSLVFVDDNPAERAIVRQLVPEVAVPELPDDVTGYVRALEQHRYFQVLSVAAEDFQRTEYYRADSLRKDMQTSAADMESFLRSLEMVAQIGPITSATLERSAQLIQRSNQFNLTTRRHSPSELGHLMSDPMWITLTVSLADRFGDNGLISVLLAKCGEETLEIDTWLMSCRVLKRGVEQFLLNYVCGLAEQRELKRIRGVYIPTSKNALVKNHYADLGFVPSGNGNGGRTEWELSLTPDRQSLTAFIKEKN